MARSILFSIMFITGALGVVIFSAAQFTDAENITSNTVQAGTVDLVTSSSVTCTYASHGLEGAPSSLVGANSDGDAVCVFTVRHNGSLPNTNLYAMLDFTHYACDNSSGPGLNDGSQYCASGGQDNGGANLTENQFVVTAGSLTGGSGYTAEPAFTSPTPSSPVELNSYLSSCTRIITSVPVNQEITGSFTVELQQDRTSNWMQGDAIDITVHFELAEFGAEDSSIDCVLDDPSEVTPT